MASTDEFIPLDHFNRIIKLWWLVSLLAIIGGLTGLIITRIKPPLYEAQAVFTASIDFNKVNFMHPPSPTPVPYQLTQYDEDISLAVVDSSLREVVPQVVTFAQQNGLSVDADGLTNMSSIERKHAFWELHFRYTDPVLVQKIVNYWAQLGFSNLQAKQKAGQLPAYIFVELTQLAEVPKKPTYFQTDSFVLAGGMIGLVIGIVAVNLPINKKGKGR